MDRYPACIALSKHIPWRAVAGITLHQFATFPNIAHRVLTVLLWLHECCHALFDKRAGSHAVLNSTVKDSDRKLGNCSGDLSCCCLKQQNGRMRHRTQYTASGIPSCYLLTSSLSGSSCSGKPPGGNHTSACAFLVLHSMEPHAPFCHF